MTIVTNLDYYYYYCHYNSNTFPFSPGPGCNFLLKFNTILLPFYFGIAFSCERLRDKPRFARVRPFVLEGGRLYLAREIACCSMTMMMMMIKCIQYISNVVVWCALQFSLLGCVPCPFLSLSRPCIHSSCWVARDRWAMATARANTCNI